MSDDPKRWRDDEDNALKGFVAALATAAPSDAMKDRVWSRITPTLPPTPGSGSSGGGAGGIGSMKLAGFAGLVIASGALIYGLTRPPAPAPSAAAPSIATPVVTASFTSEAPSPLPSPSLEPAPSAPVPKPSAKSSASTAHSAPPSSSSTTSVAPTPSLSPADRLREEAEGVRRARLLLRDHSPTAALAELDRLQKLAPNGPLEEEREVLTIEALAASGKTDIAKRRAERFLDERPQSVHAARVRGLAGK